MESLKITLDDNESIIIGSNELTSLHLNFMLTNDGPSPLIKADGYILKNEILDSRLEWTLPEITKNTIVKIEVVSSNEITQPSNVDKREGYKVKEERLYIKQQITKIKRVNHLLQAKIKEMTETVGPKEEAICVFCGCTQSESRVLVSGPVANICNSCVEICQSTIEQQLDA